MSRVIDADHQLIVPKLGPVRPRATRSIVQRLELLVRAAASRRDRRPRHRGTRGAGPWYSDRPVSMSTSQSHTCSSSLRSCDDTSTVRPVPARPPIERSHLAHALRIEPVGRFVEDQQLGIAEQRGGDAEPLLHAQRVVAVAVVAAAVQADVVEQAPECDAASCPPTVANMRRFSAPVSDG